MFLITCCYGTRKVAWTRCEALAWLAACGPIASISNRFTGRELARREVRA